MRSLTYLAHLTPHDGGCLLVSFADVPEALTQGAGIGEAIEQAEDALAVALEGYLSDGRDFPPRSEFVANAPAIIVEVPIRPEVAGRWLVRREMRRQSLSQVGLGCRMGRDEKTIRRITTSNGASLDLVLEALAALGIHPALAV